VPKKSEIQDREDLARKLRLALHAREWNQSDLARAANLPRELISTYVRGTSFPTSRSLRRLADALQMKIEDLAPLAPGLFQWEPPPTMEITGLANGMARIMVNTVVPIAVALEIGRLIERAQPRQT
jgi:transcriptional regulator with XRE-family HTH domain